MARLRPPSMSNQKRPNRVEVAIHNPAEINSKVKMRGSSPIYKISLKLITKTQEWLTFAEVDKDPYKNINGGALLQNRLTSLGSYLFLQKTLIIVIWQGCKLGSGFWYNCGELVYSRLFLATSCANDFADVF